jgi:hypothetical protein
MPSLAPFGQAVSEEKIFLTLANQKKLFIVVEPFLSFIFILCKLKEFYFSSDTRQSRLGNLLTEKAVRMDRELNKVCVLDY